MNVPYRKSQGKLEGEYLSPFPNRRTRRKEARTSKDKFSTLYGGVTVAPPVFGRTYAYHKVRQQIRTTGGVKTITHYLKKKI